MANSTGSIRLHRELKEEIDISRTIDTGLNGSRGNYHVEKMGFLVTITWNRGIQELNELWFTLRVTDKSHAIGDRFNVVFTALQSQGPRNEPACFSGDFYSQFRIVFEPNVPLVIRLSITKVRKVTTDGRFGISDEAYLRPKKLLMDMYGSLDSTGDVLITTDLETVFKAHKVILENQSPIFKIMLAANDASHIHLEDTLDDAVVTAFIKFMYLGWTDNTQTDLRGLVKLASRYDVQDLVEACWNRLVRTLSVENCVELLILAKDFGDKEGDYKRKVGRFVVENFRDLRGTEQYAGLVRDHTQLYLEICGVTS